jgi:hypothetical protein
MASSCRTCDKYCLKASTSCLSLGASKAWFKGKLASPGIAKLVSKATFRRAYHLVSAETLFSFFDITNLFGIFWPHGGFNLGQTFANKKDAIDHKSICRTFDFKVSEEGIRSEQT